MSWPKVQGQVTVAELIEQLQKLPQDALVLSEGCDCYGECAGAEILPQDDGSKIVLVTRV